MGIRARNGAPESIFRNRYRFGLPVYVPPGDEQWLAVSTALADDTADADFTLGVPLLADGGYLAYPVRPFIVLRNAGTVVATKLPALTQVNPSFQGADDVLEILIEGELEGTVQSEIVRCTFATATAPGSLSRIHWVARRFYDKITRIAHQNKEGDWGTVEPALFCVGVGNGEFGNASPNRIEVRAPFRIAGDFNSVLKRMVYLDDNTSFQAGSGSGGTSNVLIDNNDSTLKMPGKAPDFRTSAGLVTIDTTTNVFTKTTHGLHIGSAVRFEPYADGLPTGLAVDTTYYVKTVPTADTFTLSTPGAYTTELDVIAAGPFATGEAVRMYLPTRKWREAMLVYSGGVYAEGV